MTRTSGRTDAHDPVDAREQVRKRVESIKVCMFTSVERDGTLRSRPLTTQAIDADGTLWFFVSASSDVASAVQQDPHVSVSYADHGDSVYATLRGSATVLHDPAKAEELWSKMVEAWFPGGPSDPKVALLRVDVDDAEYWKPEGTKIGQFVSIARAALTHTSPREGEHRKVAF